MPEGAAHSYPSTPLPNPGAAYGSDCRARYYDPAAGRFLREDPVRFRAEVNFYQYVMNPPVNRADPLGLCPNTCAPSGNAPSPRQFQAMGYVARGSWFFGFGVGAGANLGSLAMFKRGSLLDAQVIYGGSQAYANYVYGVYMCAEGYPLSAALAGANVSVSGRPS